MKKDGKELIEMENEIKRLREDNRALQIELDSRDMMIMRIKQSGGNKKSSQLEEKVLKMEQKLTNQAKKYEESEIHLRGIISSLKRQSKEAALKVTNANRSALKTRLERDSKSEEIKNLRYLLKKSQNALQSINLKECQMKVTGEKLECHKHLVQPLSSYNHELNQTSIKDTRNWSCSVSDCSNMKQFSTQMLENNPKHCNQTTRFEQRFSTENCHNNCPINRTTESYFTPQLPNQKLPSNEREFVGYQNMGRTYPQNEHGGTILSRYTYPNELTPHYKTHELTTNGSRHSSETYFTVENTEIKKMFADILNKICSGFVNEHNSDANLSNTKNECLTIDMNKHHQDSCSMYHNFNGLKDNIKKSYGVLCEEKIHVENNFIGMNMQGLQISCDIPNQSEPSFFLRTKDKDKFEEKQSKSLPLTDQITLMDVQNESCPTNEITHLSRKRELKDEIEPDYNPNTINEDREITQIDLTEEDSCAGKDNIVSERLKENQKASTEVPIEITISSENAAEKLSKEIKNIEPNTEKSTIQYESIIGSASEAKIETYGASEFESDSESKLTAKPFLPEEVSLELFEKHDSTNQGNDTINSKESRRSSHEE